MNESLNIHLDQISKLISDLRKSDIQIEKLVELDKSLEMLSNKIKTAHLDIYGEEDDADKNGTMQDAVFYFDKNFRVLRFIGAFGNIKTAPDNNSFTNVSSFFTPEDFKFFKKRTEDLYKTFKRQIFDSRIISRNGLLLPVQFRLEKVSFANGRDAVAAGMVFFQQNPSELWDYQKILLENLPGIDVYLFDHNFVHVLTGGKEKERFGLTNADFNGKTLFEVFDEKTQKRLYPFYKNALDGKISEGEIRIKNHVYAVSSAPVYGVKKEAVGGALISQDVSREKEVEKNLIKAKKEAEESNKAKTIFMANMSHEIRTPLNSITGFIGLLNKTKLTPVQQKYARLISQSGNHLLSVVNEILFIFKLGMGKVYIEKVPFNTNELLLNVYESLLLKAKEKNLTFRTKICDRVPEIVIGDSFRVKQILNNLADNAIKYTDTGEVRICICCEKETSKFVFLRFDVEDTGIGISRSNLNTIFQVFVQSDLKEVNNRKGTGLGLNIVQKLVNLLNGRLHVESELNKGSKFSVVLPFEKAQNKKNHTPRKEYGLEFNLLKGKKILYADDDENNILLGESIFKEWDTDYRIAYDGVEAMRLLEDEKFDIALLDIQMPGMKGTEVIQKVKSRQGNPNNNTRMLALTANVMDSEIKKYIKSGFDDYVLKPFSEELLYNKICYLLDLDYKLQMSFDTGENAGDSFKLKGEKLFDTSVLMQTSGNDRDFFNSMIDIFINNAKDSSEIFSKAGDEYNGEEIGKRAHKIIPSFRYFKLDDLVSGLVKLEKLGLHEKDDEALVPLAKELSHKINKIIDVVRQHKFQGNNH
jgi:signal transduction histidine kinase